MILVAGLLMASTAMPPAAEARPFLLKMLHSITSPLGALGRGGRHASRRAHHSHRRATASRRVPAAIAAAPAAAVAGTATATVGAPADATTTGLAPVQAANAPDNPDAGAVPLPKPAPPQRNAAVEAPDKETRARGEEFFRDREPSRVQPRLGVVGPPAWPTAYEDVIGFTLWPKEYGQRLRAHGIGDVLATALAPAASIAARTRPNEVSQARADETNGASATDAPAASCGSVDLTSADWPIAEIEKAIEPNDAQRAALGRLKTALSDAVSSIKSACRNDTNLAPVERLRAMQNTLWAVHDAAQLVRAPLAQLYDSLTEQQKQTFAAPAAPQSSRAPSRSEMARMCDLPASADAPMRQIEQSVRPTKAQHASLELLQKKAFEMGQFLMASCLKPTPATPAERLDAAADRLTAVIFAASNVNMALNDFTSQLSDEQKTKLNDMVR
jgi:hypothetical protein